MDNQKPPQMPSERSGHPETPDSGGSSASGAYGPTGALPDDINWAAIFAAGPGRLMPIPETESTQTEPEIPMPAELAAEAQHWDHAIDSVFGLIGLPPGSQIVTTITRALWAEISAAHMAYRRHCAAITQAHTELDYYGEDHP